MAGTKAVKLVAVRRSPTITSAIIMEQLFFSKSLFFSSKIQLCKSSVVICDNKIN